MKNIFTITIMWFALMVTSSCNASDSEKKEFTLSKSELLNKIKGGWAGQVIGCTYEVSFGITGCGFVLTGYAAATSNQKDKVLEADIYIDNNFIETIKMPTSSLIRKHEVAWNYDLPEGEHTITLKQKNIPESHYIHIRDIIVYSGNNPGKPIYF